MRSVRVIALFSLAFVSAMVGFTPLPAHAAGPSVTITENNAEIETDFSVGFAVNQNRFRTKDDQDFLAFGQNVLPAKLISSAGTAEGFAQQASTITGPTT